MFFKHTKRVLTVKIHDSVTLPQSLRLTFTGCARQHGRWVGLVGKNLIRCALLSSFILFKDRVLGQMIMTAISSAYGESVSDDINRLQQCPHFIFGVLSLWRQCSAENSYCSSASTWIQNAVQYSSYTLAAWMFIFHGSILVFPRVLIVLLFGVLNKLKPSSL